MASKSTYKEQLETKDEPVAWEQFHEHMAGPNYVAPQREWVGLTRDEQSFVYDTLKNSTTRKDSFWVDFANAIGQALKEKNT